METVTTNSNVGVAEPDRPAVRPVIVAPPEVVPLSDVVGAIGADSRIEPGAYLSQVVVPFGGE